MPDLTEIWYSAIEGKELPREHRDFIERELNSMKPERKVLANSILFMSADTRARESAFNELKGMCEAWTFQENPNAGAVLLLTLERFSKQQIQENRCFAEFVYKSAAEPHVPVRLNSMRVLGRLAKFGDSKAVEILKASAKDPNFYVSSAAQTALKSAES